MRIQQVAQILGVSPDTIRRAERRGIITPARDWTGARRFTEADVERLRAALFGAPRTQGDDAKAGE